MFQTFGYKHLSAGDLLRAERQKSDSVYKEEIERHIKNGSIVPVEITCSLLKQVKYLHLIKSKNCSSGRVGRGGGPGRDMVMIKLKLAQVFKATNSID